MNDKLQVVFVGHVDHGKSTLIGRLLYDTDSVPEDKIKDMKSSNSVQGELDFAFLMDHFEEERNQGITIDTSQIFFRSKSREYVIIDTPGHVEFIVNMVTGAAQADVAVLIIDANEGIQEQTKRHAYILSLLGIKQVILAVNKMDLVEYQEIVFREIVSNIVPFLKKVDINSFTAVPISAVNGDNITIRSSNMSWYCEMTLLDMLDSIETTYSFEQGEIIFPVQDVYNTKIQDKKCRVIVGKVETGEMKICQEISVLPSGEKANIKSLEKFDKQCEIANTGESIGLVIDKPLFIERGNIIVAPANRQTITSAFKATVFWMNSNMGKVGERLSLRCSTQEVGCTVKTIITKINSSTLETINDEKEYMNKMEVCDVEVCTKYPLIVNEVSVNNVLSRFVLLKDNNIVAGGIITSI